MKLYVKQKVFSWKDKFSVVDENENLKYFAESEIFTFGKKIHLHDECGMEVAFISETVTFFMPRFSIIRDGSEVAEVVREFSLFRPKYRIDGLGWRVEGDFFDHEYWLTDENGAIVTTVSKAWFSWGDAYEIDISDSVDPVTALAVVLIIDAVLADQNN
jgi:uncharacterized protein YxjI